MSDTKELQPHEQRVVDECKELIDKAYKLSIFISGEMFMSLSDNEKTLMRAQLDVMLKYVDILEERIELFNKK